MNRKKLTATLTAVLCAASTFAAFPALNTQAVQAVYNDFEVTYNGWHGSTDTTVLEAVEGAGYAGSRGMMVSGRTSENDGAASSKGFYLVGGVTYIYSVRVQAATAETFRLSVLTIDENDETNQTIKEIAVRKAGAGEWTTLTGKYTAPADSYEFELKLTTDSTSDFVFDDVEITSKQDTTALVASAAEKGLKDEFAGYFRVGNILNGGTIRNSAITATLLKDCNAIECENETKPDAILKANGSTNDNINISLGSCSAIMDFCVQNNLGFRGHTMVWHGQMPQWFFKEGFNANANWVDKNTMNTRMESEIKNTFAAIAREYPTLDLYAYDICNECVSDNQQRTANNGGSRDPGWGNGASPWVQIYGDNSFVENAFTYARKYAPSGCKLYYNDYNEYWDHKRDCIYNMCKSLYQKGVLDGVGMQSHINADMGGFSGIDAYKTAMYKYLSIGCDVQVTELDISVESGKYSYTDQANKYAAVFQAAMDWNDNPQSDGRVTLVQIWGPNDAHSWLKAGSDGLLYDKNNQPKAAYNKLISMIPESQWGQGSTPQPDPEPDEKGYWQNADFDNSTSGFSGRGAATVAVSSDKAYSGSKSLFVSGRTAEWNGACTSLNSRIYKAGETYSFSATALYTGGADADTFYLSLQYDDANGDTKYAHIAEANVAKGQWVQLTNQEYQLPAGASNFQLYVEMPESTSDFYIDDVIVAKSGTVVDGPGAPTVRIRTSALQGDVNGDGEVDVFDIAYAKRGLLKAFANKYDEQSADIDGSGKVEVIDILYLCKYVHKQIDKFPELPEPQTEAPTDPPKSNFNYPSSISYHEPQGKDYTKPNAQSGTVTREYYSSINGDNTCLVYTPYGYDPSKKYNILYLMHGGGENEKVIFEEFKLNNILDNMIANGELEPLIVVTPTFNKCTAQTFYKEFRASLVPFIEKKYSTYAAGDVSEDNLKATRFHRAYGGFSMGSASTWANIVHGGMEICAYWMPLSGDNWEGGNAFAKSQTVADEIDRIGLKDDEFFIIASTGSEDIAYPNMKPQYDEMMKNSKFKFSSDLSQGNSYFLVAPGKTHWWGFVRWYVYDTLPIFFHEHQN